MDWYAPLPCFVYGTLRPGGRNHAAFCRDAVSIAPAWTPGRLYLLPEGYPALVAAAAGKVTGELVAFRDPAAALRRIDDLEGFIPGAPVEYERTIVAAYPLAGGPPVDAWAYTFPTARIAALGEAAVLIPEGAWRDSAP